MANIFTKLLSLGADKDLKRFEKKVLRVNELEGKYQAMSDDELFSQTVRLKERLEAGETLDDVLFDAFATMRETSKRVLGMRHFDVQLIGGMALHEGMIAEMKTGEGKTLVSTLAGYLNALEGKGVHIVTVNDYLAKRDSEWMAEPYRRLGMRVGLLQNGMDLSDKKPNYDADVTYGTNSEFGFDYLRDNMVTQKEERVQRGHHFAIVDEVDSILIDEARTPLIISGAGARSSETYNKFAKAVRGLKEEQDFEKDEAKHTIAATEEGLEKIERRLGIDNIYADMSGQLVNHLQQALKADYLFSRDVNYVVVDDEVKIVDEFTGRIMEGRRYSDGLHQALEAKEGVLVRGENQTLATITLQNYFRLYDKLSGMTGTALTEDSEFKQIYNLKVQPIPTNKPIQRKDEEDLVYRTIDAKFNAVADEIERRHANGQPVLVGTVSIESSERLSRLLNKRGIKHEILNAKQHEREASIVAQAGREGAVTIATNMAGRGTDILLGGNPQELVDYYLKMEGIDPEEATEAQRESALTSAQDLTQKEKKKVLEAGGLTVIGTERHESRRIDNQLRGRSGRQGDPGSTQFYLSLEDDLMRLFAGDRMDKISNIMVKTKLPDDMPIQHGMVSKSVEGAQRKIEQMNFQARKNVLEYDDVMNKQRKVIYEERNKILDGKDVHEHVQEVMQDTVEKAVASFIPDRAPESEWDLEGISNWVHEMVGRDDFDARRVETEDDPEIMMDAVYDYIENIYKDKENTLGEEVMRELESQVMLRIIDSRWMAHLSEMDYIKAGIGLRGFGQRDPLVEYKQEAYTAFGDLVETMYQDFLRTILRLEIARPEEQMPQNNFSNVSYSGPAEVDGDNSGRSSLRQRAASHNAGPQVPQADQGPVQTYVKAEDSNPFVGVGRNDPCPCGSGLKFKNCHGKN